MATPKQAAKTDEKTARIMLVDDHPVLRMGLARLINAEDDMEVCGEAAGAVEALQVTAAAKPDVMIVDLSLKEGNGLDLIKDMRIRHEGVRLLVLSMHEETFYAERVLRAGARGYITKIDGTEKVVEGIRAVLEGHVFVSDKMREKMLLKMVGEPVGTTSSIERLTDRELQVFDLLGNGMSTRNIAENLHLSVKTIESHRENIKSKLGIDNATDLLKHAIEWVRTKQDV